MFRFAIVLTVTLVATMSARADSPVVAHAAPSSVMLKAIADARASLPRFLAVLATRPAETGGYALKVMLPHDGGEEHIWTIEVRPIGGGLYRAEIANAPLHLALSEGDLVEFEQARIADWLFWKRGRIEGGYTLRALLPDLPEDEADALKEVLAPLPAPSGG